VRLRFLAPLSPLALALAVFPAVAHAEPTSWFSVGGGYALERNTVTKAYDNTFAVDGAVGIGTPATQPVVVGGVFRTVGYVNFGADMSLSLRIAMQSYCVGDFGLALDLGVGARLWGNGQYGNYPLHGAVIAGVPFGFQLVVGADGWDVSEQTARTKSAWGGFAALEFDFLRLTTMRNGNSTKIWSNPSPANAPPAATPTLP
jgi:hypothetical protein